MSGIVNSGGLVGLRLGSGLVLEFDRGTHHRKDCFNYGHAGL